jgi:hypothetical protein
VVAACAILEHYRAWGGVSGTPAGGISVGGTFTGAGGGVFGGMGDGGSPGCGIAGVVTMKIPEA